MNKIKKSNFLFFFNSLRGYKIIEYFQKKKFKIQHIFVAKKFLDKKVIYSLKKKKLNFTIIGSLKNKKINQNLVKCDFALICGFPLIFKKEMINLPKKGFLNCHAGLLPKYRGGSPLNWQLINNEKYFGISILNVTKKIDSGEIVESKKFKLLKKHDIRDLHKISNKAFPRMLVSAINKILNKKKLKKLNFRNRKYFKQRSEKDSILYFGKKNFIDANCFVRALQEPYPNAFIFHKKRKLKIKSLKPATIFLKPGKILKKNNKIFIGLKDKTAQIIN